MSDSQPMRVLIVNSRRKTSRSWTASLKECEYHYDVVLVASGEEAMLEFSGMPYDLIVANYRLPGMSGVDVVGMAQKRMPDVRALLTAEEDTNLDRVRRESVDLPVDAILTMPFEAEDVVRTVNHILFGPTASEDISADVIEGGEEDNGGPLVLHEHFGYIPPVNEAILAETLGSLAQELAAQAVMLVSRAGEIVYSAGRTDSGLDIEQIALYLGRGFNRLSKLAPMLGHRSTTSMSHTKGSDYDLYTLSVGLHYFILLVFNDVTQRRLGNVLRLARPASNAIILTMGDAAFLLDEPTDEPAETVFAIGGENVEVGEPMSVEEALAVAQEVTGDEADFDEEAFVDALFGQSFATTTGPIDLDLDGLDAELGGLDETGDLDSFWEDAASEAEIKANDALSFEEAMQMGIYSDDDEE
ncbi:MAG: response regulator [Chloroflexi bacterium]|nr:response regulator [Chloroflexota bacterium]